MGIEGGKHSESVENWPNITELLKYLTNKKCSLIAMKFERNSPDRDNLF